MRHVKIGAGMVSEAEALRTIADNLDQIERLKRSNVSIWRGIAESAEEQTRSKNEQTDQPRSVKGKVGEGQAIGPGTSSDTPGT